MICATHVHHIWCKVVYRYWKLLITWDKRTIIQYCVMHIWQKILQKRQVVLLQTESMAHNKNDYSLLS